MCIICFGTLDDSFSSDWHHEVFLLPTKRRICGPLVFVIPGRSSFLGDKYPDVRVQFATCVFALHAQVVLQPLFLKHPIITPPPQMGADFPDFVPRFVGFLVPVND